MVWRVSARTFRRAPKSNFGFLPGVGVKNLIEAIRMIRPETKVLGTSKVTPRIVVLSSMFSCPNAKAKRIMAKNGTMANHCLFWFPLMARPASRLETKNTTKAGVIKPWYVPIGGSIVTSCFQPKTIEVTASLQLRKIVAVDAQMPGAETRGPTSTTTTTPKSARPNHETDRATRALAPRIPRPVATTRTTAR